ncbi:MAG: threonine synthase [Candidatus Gracilibacteria bacterium]|nr:threonine synthase [Candidatus Gracilibacteria bacterium]
MTTLFDTRSKQTTTLQNAIKSSQPLSGGLWAIKDLPKITLEEIEKLVGESYQEVAFQILSKFDFGLSSEDLKEIINNAYGNQWHNKDITPVKQMGDTNLFSLHLGYGPTFAFKNVALEFLPRLLSKLSPGEIINVVGASSGDTINAAHSGVKGTNIRSIFMLTNYGPSYVQKLQAVNGISNNPNAFTLLADTPFDPLQDIVKKLNSKEFADFKSKHKITSFNSINIARILAQIVYYFRAYSELLKSGNIQIGEKVVFSVPSGNFGDALAGYYAKKMGLPIEKIVVATNENDMLKVFFDSGVYAPPKKDGKDFVKITNAPSMDIAKSSNFERVLFDIYNFDDEKIKSLYDELARTGEFRVENEILNKIREIFISASCTNEERVEVIKYFGETFNHGIDPHGATAVIPFTRGDFDFGSKKIVFLETSHIAQFKKELQEKGVNISGMNEFDKEIEKMEQNKGVEGKNYIMITGEFDEAFETIKKAIEMMK